MDIEFPNECDVDMGRYRFNVDPDTGVVDCSRNKGCKLAQCTCDAEFAYSVGTFWEDKNHNEFYWLSKRNKKIRAKKGLPIMKVEDTCKMPTGEQSVDTCCGNSFPHKQPFDSGLRSCCASSGRTYDFATQECCADGSIKSPGAC